MTAEIALLNRSALALAADSAVTLRIGSSFKTSNTAEKIFEFSCSQPIALMIYNNVEWVGVPFDVIIRKHRAECKNSFDKLKDAADEFLRYLLDFERKKDQEGSYFAAILIENFKFIYAEFSRIARKSINNKAAGKPALKVKELLGKFMEEKIKDAESNPLDDFLTDKTLDDFKSVYAEVCDQAIRTAFKGLPLVSEHMELLYRLAFALMRSAVGSDILTGLVFGGFGKKDLFPTLHYMEIDGIYFGQLKILDRKEVDIDRDGDHAEMIPFAQKEMAERFIHGIDGEFTQDISSFVASIVDEIVKVKPASFSTTEIRKIKQIVSNNFDETLKNLTGVERESILDIVTFMSKKELAEMASALVEITSAKRRFSMDQETVGGPIDAAVVSRSEGFVWIRRKHYFDPNANPGYFARVFPGTNGRRN